MSLLKSFYHSLFDLNWLKNNKCNAKKAWGYFFVFMLFITLVQFGTTVYTMPKAVKEFRDNVEQKAPDFEASIKDGELTLNKLTQPYIYEGKEGGETIKVYIDASATSTLNADEILQGFDTGFLIAKTKIFIKDGSSQNTSISIAEIPNKNFSKSDVINLMDRFKGLAIAVISLLLVAFMYVFLFAGKLFFLLIISLIALIISSITKKQWKFGEIYTIGLFAVTLPTLIKTIEFWFGINIPLVYTVFLMMLILGAIFSKEKMETPPVETHTHA